jgi:AMME syndrome candidate gene 1 protein
MPTLLNNLMFNVLQDGHTETIDSLMKKAGYNGHITESIRKKIRVTRYQSTLYTMHYGEYIAYAKKNRGAARQLMGHI